MEVAEQVYERLAKGDLARHLFPTTRLHAGNRIIVESRVGLSILGRSRPYGRLRTEPLRQRAQIDGQIGPVEGLARPLTAVALAEREQLPALSDPLAKASQGIQRGARHVRKTSRWILACVMSTPCMTGTGLQPRLSGSPSYAISGFRVGSSGRKNTAGRQKVRIDWNPA
ncbi:hypothetical protein [Mesorhizobium sp.]|uniref:hypothetical protein n=1 Tax=Mesorhizobium sp. TaxID=1871066 RepID=UPI0011F6D25E|nr:hypothetical protein [Mesorhizobium sp.]TIO79429.1 MAG: hypothetical protein E5X75_02415 [Mesorhizobium sp.]